MGKTKDGTKEVRIQRNHKDSVVCRLFSGRKESLSLYNGIFQTNYTNEEELEIVTLDNAIYIGRKNDNAVILHFNMMLTEFQTTVNPNMPLRMLIYVAREYEKYIARHNLNLYSEYRQEIPTPHFVTLYYGIQAQPETSVFQLSDLYKEALGTSKTADSKETADARELELRVTQYNINPGYHEELKKRCPELAGYIAYVEKTRKYHKQGMSYGEAVKKAVDDCIKEGILKEFFQSNKSEVVAMTIFEYDEEEHMRLERAEHYEKGLEQGIEKGLEQGIEKGLKQGIERGFKQGSDSKLLELIEKKLAKGKSIAQIADELEESEEVIQKLISQ